MKHIFISPHIDDAMLSLGGLIIKLLSENNSVDIHYVFTITNWVNPEVAAVKSYAREPAVISNIRKEEEISIGRRLGYTYRFMDFTDYVLRKKLDAATQGSMIAELETALFRLMDKENIYYFPIALEHPDHIVVRDMAIKFLRMGFNILFYEDMPYLAGGGYDPRKFYNTLIATGLVPEQVFIDFAKKRAFLRQYESQVVPLWLMNMMNYSYSPNDNAYIERWWKPVSV